MPGGVAGGGGMLNFRIDWRKTRCSLPASDKGSYHREWPSEPSNHEESIEASRKNILRTEERGLLNVWTDFNRNTDSESPDDCDENYTV